MHAVGRGTGQPVTADGLVGMTFFKKYAQHYTPMSLGVHVVL